MLHDAGSWHWEFNAKVKRNLEVISLTKPTAKLDGNLHRIANL